MEFHNSVFGKMPEVDLRAGTTQCNNLDHLLCSNCLANGEPQNLQKHCWSKMSNATEMATVL
jgi:hypothetical protein